MMELLKNKNEGKRKNLLEESLLVRIFKKIYFLVTDFRGNIGSVFKLLLSMWDSIKDFRTDIYCLMRVSIIYIACFKVGVSLTLIFIGSYLLIELLFLSLIYSYRRIFPPKLPHHINESSKERDIDGNILHEGISFLKGNMSPLRRKMR